MYGVELYSKVRMAVLRDGVSRREAARRFGIDRETVAKMVGQAAPGPTRPHVFPRPVCLRRPDLRSPCSIRRGYRATARSGCTPRAAGIRWRPFPRGSCRNRRDPDDRILRELDLFIVISATTVSATSTAPAPGYTSPVLTRTAATAAVRLGRLHVPDWAQAPRVR
jgi:hypothetical protein